MKESNKPGIVNQNVTRLTGLLDPLLISMSSAFHLSGFSILYHQSFSLSGCLYI